MTAMSELTKAALDEAIQNHFAVEADGGIVNSYVLQIAGGNIEDYDADQNQLLRVVAEHQSFVTSIGLAHYAGRALDIAFLAENE